MAVAQSARGELEQLRRTGSEVDELLRLPERLALEKRLGMTLQLLGAYLVDAVRLGRDAVDGLVGVLVPNQSGDELIAMAAAHSVVSVANGVELRHRAAANEPGITAEVTSVEPPAKLELSAVEPMLKHEMPPLVVTPELRADLGRRMRENQGMDPYGARADGQTIAPDVSLFSADTLTPAARKVLETTWQILGETPLRFNGKRDLEMELGRVEQIVTGTLEGWAAAGPKLNLALTAWVAARARAVQDAVRELAAGEHRQAMLERADKIFPRLRGHSAKTRPGMVYGLARKHGPKSGSWTADACAAEVRVHEVLPPGVLPEETQRVEPERLGVDDRLRRLHQRVREGLDGTALINELWPMVVATGMSEPELSQRDSRLVGLLRSYLLQVPTEATPRLEALGLEAILLGPLRKMLADEMAQEAEQAVPPTRLRPDWPHFAVTRGLKALIVGGEPRPRSVKVLKETFGFQELEWVENACGRPLDGVVQRMQSGSVGLVIVLSQHVNHSTSDRLFQARSTGCLVVLAPSYGVSGIQQAIERYVTEPGGRSDRRTPTLALKMPLLEMR